MLQGTSDEVRDWFNYCCFLLVDPFLVLQFLTVSGGGRGTSVQPGLSHSHSCFDMRV